MYKTTLMVALLVAMSATGVVSLDAQTRDSNFGVGPLTTDVIVDRLGYVPTEVRMISYTPEPVESFFTWEEFGDMMALTAAAQVPDVALSPIGVDVGQGTPDAPPFCDNSSVWIQYQGSAGETYQVAEELGPGTAETCFGVYGPSFTWLIVMSTAAVSVAYEGCFATTWALGADGYCPTPFTGGDTFGQAVINGNGVRTTWDFGAGNYFDYFLGNGATVAYTP